MQNKSFQVKLSGLVVRMSNSRSSQSRGIKRSGFKSSLSLNGFFFLFFLFFLKKKKLVQALMIIGAYVGSEAGGA